MKEDSHDLKILFDLCYQKSTDEQEQIISNSNFSHEIKQKVKKLLNIDVENVELTSSVMENVQLSLNINPIFKGMIVESYVLDNPLGKGGQGEVWLAQRNKGDFNHQVAIKFLKPVHNKKELDRFNNERELLAQLKHSNIAQLLGGGQLPDKRPYMILELIEGMPLMDYCDQNNYSLKQYLHCFLQICDAISYAHSHLVIHRDIKPSNIFVNHDGVVKLLDFGIAKIIGDQAINTQTVPIMTLAYSSPEQVNGDNISTATDIYTLGLVLYEMLTGQRAQAVSSEAPSDLIHEISDITPTNPSKVEVLLQLDRDYSNKQLRGDLDNLILMAVRKEPERRYTTVATMAKDVENFLEGKPLLTTGDSWWYKTKKLVSRNPSISALSLLTFGFLIVLPIILYNSQLQIQQQRDLEIVAREDAQKQTLLAKRTTDFLYNILESASPLASKGESVNLDDVLQVAERQLAYGLDNQAELKAELLSKLASIYHHLGKSDKTIVFYEKALVLYSQNGDKQQQLKTLGQLAITFRLKGDTQQSNKYRDQAIAMSRNVTDAFELGWHKARMATLWFSMNNYAKIRESTPKTLAMLAQNNITDPELLGRLYNGLSLAYGGFDNFKALDYNAKALDYALSLHGEMHPNYQNRLFNRAIILKRLERYDDAEVILVKVKSNAEKLYTQGHPAYAKVLAELGAFYHDKGHFSKAENLYKQAQKIAAKTVGKNSTTYVYQTNNLGYLYEDRGQYDQAEKYYRESLKIRQEIYADDQLLVARSMENLARLLTKMRQFKQAQDYLKQVIPIYILNNKSNLPNKITQIGVDLGENISSNNCQQVIVSIQEVLPEVNKISTKSWRRMYYELRLGKMAYQCKNYQLARNMLVAAQAKSVSIYANNSDGQKRIHAITQKIINKMTL